jgi:hypothetical protein
MKPTPETDALDNLTFSTTTLFSKCRELERRLAECREALAKVVKTWDDATWLNESDFESFRETLTNTAPKP